MFYKVVNGFKDSQDNKREYKKDSIYPRAGYTPSAERIDELSSVHPKENKVFIAAIQMEEENILDGKQENDVNDNLDGLLTAADIKKMNKGPQEDLIKDLGGDPSETKNEDERIALILDLQEQEQEQKEDNGREPSPE
jgi:hypothetical protein